MDFRKPEIAPSGYSCRLLSYGTLYVVLLCVAALSFVGWPEGLDYNDSPTYRQAWHAYRTLEVDIMRPPLYPCLIGTLTGLFGETVGRIAVVAFQWVLFFWSVIYSRRCAAMLIPGRRTVFWATAVYALVPGVWEWCFILQTESLAVSMSVILCYHVVSAERAGRPRRLLLCGLLLSLMILLRPMFLVLLLPFGIYVILTAVSRPAMRARWFAYGAVSVMLSALFVAPYWYGVHQTFGLNSMSIVSTFNNYHAAREMGLVTAHSGVDPRIDGLIGQMNEECHTDGFGMTDYSPEVAYLLENVTYAELESYVDGLMAGNPAAVCRYTVDKFSDRLPDYPVVQAVMISYLNNQFMDMLVPLDMADVAFILTVILAAMVWQAIKRKRLSPAAFWVWGFCAAVYIASVAGAMKEYTRLFVPAYPMLVLLVFRTVWQFGRDTGIRFRTLPCRAS